MLIQLQRLAGRLQFLVGAVELVEQAPVEQVRKELGLSALPYTVLQSMQLRLIASRHAEGSRRLLDELDRAYEELQAAGEPLQLD